MKNFKETFLDEARDKSVSTEWRIVLGTLQRLYGDKHNSDQDKEGLNKDTELAAKQAGIKDKKEIKNLQKWIETKLAFKMEKGKKISEETEELIDEADIKKEFDKIKVSLHKFLKSVKSLDKKKDAELLAKISSEFNQLALSEEIN